MIVDAGMWRLRCRKCSRVFDIELGPDDDIRRIVKQYQCPECRTTPWDWERGFQLHWHEVVGFHLSAAAFRMQAHAQ
jgi:hypothetical protein